jgi:hypothetical protein
MPHCNYVVFRAFLTAKGDLLRGYPGKKIYNWIPAFAGMTQLLLMND